MNPMPPLVCGTLLAAMMAAGVSHYWSVENFIAGFPTAPTERLVPPTEPVESLRDESVKPAPPEALTNNLAPPEETGKEFFENLVHELKNLRNENRALTDQIAETNRDIMKMQFQIDTHSESFRPLRISPDRDDRSQLPEDDFPGVLPPRASPVYPLDD